MVDIIAKAICDSIGTNSPRLFTLFTRCPKFIHQESLRHRKIYIQDNLSYEPDFSLSVSSARAIPFTKLLEEVENPETRAKPVKWGTEQKGMSPGDELDKPGLAETLWDHAAINAVNNARMLNDLGLHKSIVNRVIEPFIHVNALFTATEPGWLNFFGLRLDQAADPTLRALAEQCWVQWNESKPQTLQTGEWHLPYIDIEDWDHLWPDTTDIMDHNAVIIKVSTARCARLSYLSFETQKRSTIEEDLKLYERLVGSTPIHASPAEHQATPDVWYDRHLYTGRAIDIGEGHWERSHLSGNLGPGWVQHRKFLPNESIAPLPVEYTK